MSAWSSLTFSSDTEFHLSVALAPTLAYAATVRVGGISYRSLWLDEKRRVAFVDQNLLPDRFDIAFLKTLDDVVAAITTMRLRGAPLIGAAGMFLSATMRP